MHCSLLRKSSPCFILDVRKSAVSSFSHASVLKNLLFPIPVISGVPLSIQQSPGAAASGALFSPTNCSLGINQAQI